MNYYIGCKLVEAEQCIKTSLGDLYTYEKDAEAISMIKSNDDIVYTEGYKIVYDNGYESFSSKDAFEKSHLKVDDNPQRLSGVSISGPTVEDFIKSYEVIERDNKTVIVYATLKNGFTIVESSSCVDPKNYSFDIGKQICLSSIRNKTWELLGFAVQCAYNGFE